MYGADSPPIHPAAIPLICVVVLAGCVGLFYLACLITKSNFPPFFKSIGLVALGLFATVLTIASLVTGFAAILVLFYELDMEAIRKMSAERSGGVGVLLVRMLVTMVAFFFYVAIPGTIYNWGLKTEEGHGLASIQYGIPTALTLLVFGVGIIGHLTGVVADPSEKQTEVARVSPPPRPVSPRPAPTPTPPVSENTSQPETPSTTIVIPPTPTPPSPRYNITPSDNSASVPSSVPSQPYQGPVNLASETSADTELPNTADAATQFGQPRPGQMAAESVPFENPVGGQAVQATRPIPEGFLSRADWAMEYGQLYAAQQHLYAAAVVDDDPLVWQNVAWSETFNRPMFCVMCGVGVQGAIPPGVYPNVATAGIATAVQTELQEHARRSVFSKHANQLVQDIGISPDRNKLLANAREAGLDLLALVNLQSTRTGDVMLHVYLLNVSTGSTLWRSDGLTRTRFIRFRDQGQDLGVELAAEAGQQASRFCGLSPSCPLKEADARAQIRPYVDTRPNNPLEGLFRLKYLHRLQKISDIDQTVFLSDLVGKDAAAILSGNDLATKQQLVARWLPELKQPTPPRPAANVNRPFGGFPGGNTESSADETTPEGAAAEAEPAPLPRRPATPGAGSNRFFID